MTTATAAVMRGLNTPFSFEQIEVTSPESDEVLVKVSSVGVCHTDLAVLNGGIPSPLPRVLGHEGAGTVVEVGSAVKDLAIGDQVAMSFASCGHCENCLTGREAYCSKFAQLNFSGRREDGTTTLRDGEGNTVYGSFFGQSSFSTMALVNERNAVKIPDGIDLDWTGPLGCGIQTGAGTIINTLKVAAGNTVIVSGTGAVGLSAILAARAAGATKIIAVDVLEPRLKKALELGATHAIDGGDDDLVAKILAITGGGADFAVDTTAIPAVMNNVMDGTRQGGKIALVGVGRPDASVPVRAMNTKSVYNVVEGDAVPQAFIPQLIALYQSGQFPFNRIVTTYTFDAIEQAIADTKSGAAVKAVLLMPKD